ncbi:unnamed protein product, partial [Closterium sp. NIES-53]
SASVGGATAVVSRPAKGAAGAEAEGEEVEEEDEEEWEESPEHAPRAHSLPRVGGSADPRLLGFVKSQSLSTSGRPTTADSAAVTRRSRYLRGAAEGQQQQQQQQQQRPPPWRQPHGMSRERDVGEGQGRAVGRDAGRDGGRDVGREVGREGDPGAAVRQGVTPTARRRSMEGEGIAGGEGGGKGLPVRARAVQQLRTGGGGEGVRGGGGGGGGGGGRGRHRRTSSDPQIGAAVLARRGVGVGRSGLAGSRAGERAGEGSGPGRESGVQGRTMGSEGVDRGGERRGQDGRARVEGSAAVEGRGCELKGEEMAASQEPALERELTFLALEGKVSSEDSTSCNATLHQLAEGHKFVLKLEHDEDVTDVDAVTGVVRFQLDLSAAPGVDGLAIGDGDFNLVEEIFTVEDEDARRHHVLAAATVRVPFVDLFPCLGEVGELRGDVMLHVMFFFVIVVTPLPIICDACRW